MQPQQHIKVGRRLADVNFHQEIPAHAPRHGHLKQQVIIMLLSMQLTQIIICAQETHLALDGLIAAAMMQL